MMDTMTKRSADVVAAASSVIGTTFRLHEMGGNVQCHVAVLEGGATLVLGDGNLSTDYAERQWLSVMLYAPGDFEDENQPEPIGYGDTLDMSDDAVRAAVRRALGGQ